MNFGFYTKHIQKLLVEALRKKALNKKYVSLALLSMLAPSLATAAEWRFTPSVNLTETYTDNVSLKRSSGSESDWISQINPTVSLTGKGRELALTFGYRMQNIFYTGDSGRNTTNHQLNTDLKATLLPRLLFLDASAILNQQVLSPNEGVSIGNLGVVSGREDVLTSRISPYIETRLTNRVLVDARFTNDRVTYSGNTVEDSSSEKITVGLKSAKAFGLWTWGLRYTEKNTEYSGQILTPKRNDEKLQDSVLDLGFQLSTKIRLTGRAGYEDNEYQFSADSETPEGRYWSAGVVWLPSSQTMFMLSGGHRYYGRTWALNWSHQARRNNWQLSYDENVTSGKLFRLEQREFFVGTNGLPITDPNAQIVGIDTFDVPVPFNEVFIDRRANFQWSMTHRKSTSTFQLNRSVKDLQESNVTETTTGIDLGWDWVVSRNRKFHANVGSQKTERIAGNDRYKIFNISYEKQLGRNVSSSANFRRVSRDASGKNNNYSENQLSASLRMSW